MLYFLTTDEMILGLAKRFKMLRKIKNITQKELATMSNVPFGTIKRFESKGEISLHALTKLCVAIDLDDEIINMFSNPNFKNIDEVIKYEKMRKKFEKR
ncbi:MAG: helix-turn-helix domain-containing protein [bacterium]|nr:helix-turn-helix domain-containing protein [bacterium]